MVTEAENERLTRVEGTRRWDGLIREHYWIPFALSSHLVHDAGPMPVRLLGEQLRRVPRRGRSDRVPRRAAAPTVARRSCSVASRATASSCIYHGWKIDVSGCVAEAPTQLVRPERFAAGVAVEHFPVHEAAGLAWVWLGGTDAPPFPDLPWDHAAHVYWCVCRMPCNWLQGVEGTVDSAHVGVLHRTWHAETAKLAEHANLGIALQQRPTYETETVATTGCAPPRCAPPATARPTCGSPSTSCRS